MGLIAHVAIVGLAAFSQFNDSVRVLLPQAVGERASDGCMIPEHRAFLLMYESKCRSGGGSLVLRELNREDLTLDGFTKPSAPSNPPTQGIPSLSEQFDAPPKLRADCGSGDAVHCPVSARISLPLGQLRTCGYSPGHFEFKNLAGSVAGKAPKYLGTMSEMTLAATGDARISSLGIDTGTPVFESVLGHGCEQVEIVLFNSAPEDLFEQLSSLGLEINGGAPWPPPQGVAAHMAAECQDDYDRHFEMYYKLVDSPRIALLVPHKFEMGVEPPADPECQASPFLTALLARIETWHNPPACPPVYIQN